MYYSPNLSAYEFVAANFAAINLALTTKRIILRKICAFSNNDDFPVPAFHIEKITGNTIIPSRFLLVYPSFRRPFPLKKNIKFFIETKKNLRNEGNFFSRKSTRHFKKKFTKSPFSLLFCRQIFTMKSCKP